MTIYVVTIGEYSDYRIIGVFTDKAKAERCKELHQDPYRQAEIEEYEANEPTYPHPGWFTFLVEMREDGNSSVRRIPPDDGPDQPWAGNVAFCFHVWAKDEQHAVKIANERRLQMIANGTWTTDSFKWRELVNSGRVQQREG